MRRGTARPGVMQMAAGEPTLTNCVLNVPSPSKTWMRLLARSPTYEPLCVDGDRVRDVELARSRAARAPRLQILAVAIELGDARDC